MTEENVFNEIEQETAQQPNEQTENVQQEEQASAIDYNQLSDVALGDKTSYVRESLDGQIVGIKSAEMFPPKTDDLKTSQSGKSKYYTFNFVLTYDKKNSDGIDNREYISGGKVFLQENGSLSAPHFWYEGCETQLAQLWEAVAKAKGIEAKELSPRAFMGYLNSGVKAKVKLMKDNWRNPATGKKEFFEKNLVEEFLN